MKINEEFSRERFSLTLKELIGDKSILSFSKIVGIPQTTINSWIIKTTSPSVEHLFRLAKHFDCSVDYLVELKDY
ncbi:MAG: helix-turn-helix transcriptional regulator [Firmicutes bacterium]|nr:helix-turn-helix transcriptional regulator [Bacillota bacterium]